jgi:hypothetical protein
MAHKALGARVADCIALCIMQVIGREREVARVIQILGRRTKNNPILLGEPGVFLKHMLSHMHRVCTYACSAGGNCALLSGYSAGV